MVQLVHVMICNVPGAEETGLQNKHMPWHRSFSNNGSNRFSSDASQVFGCKIIYIRREGRRFRSPSSSSVLTIPSTSRLNRPNAPPFQSICSRRGGRTNGHGRMLGTGSSTLKGLCR